MGSATLFNWRAFGVLRDGRTIRIPRAMDVCSGSRAAPEEFASRTVRVVIANVQFDGGNPISIVSTEAVRLAFDDYAYRDADVAAKRSKVLRNDLKVLQRIVFGRTAEQIPQGNQRAGAAPV